MPGSFTSKRSITPSNPLPQIPNGITKMGPLPPQRGLRTLDLEKQDRRRWTVDYAFEKDRDVKKKKSILDFFTQFV
jgi:hypothetical protein